MGQKVYANPTLAINGEVDPLVHDPAGSSALDLVFQLECRKMRP